MASYHYGVSQYTHTQQQHSQHANAHYGRSRRGPRVSSQNAHRQYKPHRSPKEEVPAAQTYSDYLRVLEAAKSFEFDDDEIFCPFNLLTEDDLHSIHSSSSSERGSLSSGSPEGSPLQQQVQPTPSLLLSAPSTYNPAAYHHNTKLHQPSAQRTRNAIKIVDPTTGRSASGTSPRVSVSPGQAQARYNRRMYN